MSPSPRQASAKALSSPATSRTWSEIVSQPSLFPISGPGPPQSVSSLLQTRRATSSWAAFFTRSAIAGSSSSGMTDSNVSGRPVVTASRLLSTPARSLSSAVTNRSTPSRRSLSVTSSMSIPASASAFIARSTSSGAASPVAPVTSSFSAHVRSVGIGMVLTVSGATRPSTYIVSE